MRSVSLQVIGLIPIRILYPILTLRAARST
jgi:hypothetical protein